jgi:alkaline phosphatase D
VLAGDACHARVDDVVVLSGDVHSSWASDLTPDPANRDVTRGGYDAASGEGSVAVEFTTTSITSPGLEGMSAVADLALAVNPQFKYADVTNRGYLLLEIDSERVCAEWWYVEGVRRRRANERFGAAYQVRRGRNRVETA